MSDRLRCFSQQIKGWSCLLVPTEAYFVPAVRCICYMSTLAVRIEQRQGLGNVLVARRALNPGDVVVHEEPLLHVPQLKPSNLLYKPLQAYFEQHGIPPSVVLKIMAFILASPHTQASVLQCFCPDPSTFAAAPVVKQARTFAALLLQHPPVPEFAEWAERQQSGQQGPTSAAAATQPTAASTSEVPAGAPATAAGPHPPDSSGTAAAAGSSDGGRTASAFDQLVRVWLIWVMNGHSFRLGSALFHYGSKLTHTCSCPNTAYRTASGDTAPVVEPADGSSSGGAGRQLQASAGSPGSRAGAPAGAGVHVALTEVAEGDILTTNYLGMGHKRLMSTPARQKLLQDKFLFKCTCHRCTQELDLARGIPCPACSAPFRAADKLLREEEALPEVKLGQPLAAASTANAAAASAGTGSDEAEGASSSSSGGSGSCCGYIYCNMTALLSGTAAPWKCDTCDAEFPDDAAELWGRFYTKSYATIESDMERWVNKLDESMDSAPLVREPGALHDRVLGIVRLLGPRHWASWRLLLLGVELHCGVFEEGVLRAQLQQRKRPAPSTAEAPSREGAGSQDHEGSTSSSTGGSSTGGDATKQAESAKHDAAAAAALLRPAMWILRYCKQLWHAVSGRYGEVEAGQVLGYHFVEAAQVLLQGASCPGLLPQSTAESLVEAALQLQQLTLPGLRSLMGPSYSPLAQILGVAVAEGSSPERAPGVAGVAAAAVPGAADAASVAALVRRQMQERAAEASKMRSLVEELRHLEANERQ